VGVIVSILIAKAFFLIITFITVAAMVSLVLKERRNPRRGDSKGLSYHEKGKQIKPERFHLD
jgi:hypothetical protein